MKAASAQKAQAPRARLADRLERVRQGDEDKQKDDVKKVQAGAVEEGKLDVEEEAEAAVDVPEHRGLVGKAVVAAVEEVEDEGEVSAEEGDAAEGDSEEEEVVVWADEVAGPPSKVLDPPSKSVAGPPSKVSPSIHLRSLSSLSPCFRL